MDDTVAISFPSPISALLLKVSHEEDLTCEAVILKCLSHVQEQMKLDLTAAQKKTDAGISTYVPAFGLQITSRKKKPHIFIPLHYKFAPHNYQKEYKFRVRHTPPCPEEESLKLSEIPFYIIIWQLFILQGIEDFLQAEQENVDLDLHSEDVVMDIATLALIISLTGLPNDDRKIIDKNFKLQNFSLFNYRKHFSESFLKLLTKAVCIPNRIFDYVYYHRKFKRWISHFKSENKFLGTYKEEFIYNFLFYHPHYGIECYDVERRMDDGTLEDCSVEIKMSQRGKIQQLGLYLNGQNSCSLAKIQQVIIEKQREDKAHEIRIATDSLEQYFCLLFKDREELDSFISLLQGTVWLSIQPNLYLHRQLMPQSSVIKQQLRSFWPMRHIEASSLLSSSNMWKPEEERRGFLIYQDKDYLYNFTVATENKDVKYQVHWTPKDKFTICQNGKPLFSYKEENYVLRHFYQEYGSQLYPKIFTKKQTVDPNSIYHLKLPELEENEEGGSDEQKDLNNSRAFILEKDIVARSKWEIANENDDLKRFRVLIKGEDKLLVEVQSNHPKAKEAIIQNITLMIQLSEVSPKSILNFQQQAFVSSMKESFVYEYPTHGTLNMFLNENRNKLSWLKKLKICLQVISVLNTIQSKGLFHGNIRSSNFYVFVYDMGEPVVKLGDPGLVYMYDDPGADFQYLNKRSPWMAPERLDNLQRINKDTECYAVGTTLCEILHATEDFKSLLKLQSDEDVMKFFREGNKIPPPDLSYSENDPNTVMPEMREIMEEAWQMVDACWNTDPNERPTALELSCKFRELIHSSSELPFERLMDYLIPVLSGVKVTGMIPKDLPGLFKEQSRYYINPDQITLTDCVLGKGHFGQVRKCQIWKQKKTGDKVEKEQFPIVAAKTLFKSANNPSMIEEINAISSLNHENVVKFLHFTFKEDKLILIMEYLEEGSLLHFVKSINRKSDKNDRKFQYFMTLLKLSHDVAEGMKHLHENRIIHRDLAARNILLYKDTHQAVTKIVAKVGDLGLAKLVKIDQNYYSTKREKAATLPFYWTAPEYYIIDENNSDKISMRYEGDVWSYGILLWEVFTLGRCPSKFFPDDEILFYKLREGWRLGREQLQFDDDRVYTDLMMKCWEWNYMERPSFNKLSSVIQGLRSSLERNLSYA